MQYLLLALAIVAEVAATLLLKASDGWSKWHFGMAAVALYSVSGLILGLVLKAMGVGVAYAIWAGSGIALVCIASVVIWGQKFDAPALVGIVLISSGVALITLKSSVVLQ